MELAEAREFFAKDLFATEAAGAVIDELEGDRALCSMEIKPVHRNAAGAVMGGAVFTLADFALAVATNHQGTHSVSVSNTIDFIGSSRGTRLFAEARPDRVGKSLCFYTVTVTDDLGAAIARMTAVVKRLSRTLG